MQNVVLVSQFERFLYFVSLICPTTIQGLFAIAATLFGGREGGGGREGREGRREGRMEREGNILCDGNYVVGE